jgi:hypothetical protein
MMQYRIIFIAFLFLMRVPPLFSRSDFQISGRVIDETKREIAYIQVQLFKINEGKVQLEAFTWADTTGAFTLHYTEPIVSGFIAFSGIGWQTDTLILHRPLYAFYNLGDIVMKASPLQLDEIIIKGEAISYYQREDTTIFKPQFFQDGSERVLEDLLAKLPGVSVAADGFLYFRGKRVSKVLWDGDDLLGADYAKATKKMPVGVANEFRFLDKYEGNPLLQSLKQSEQLVLDIETKDSFKGKWIGDSFLGIGTIPYITAGFNGYSIKKKLKLLSLIEANGFDDSSPGKKITFDEVDELNSAFQPANVLSWFVFPAFFPVVLSNPSIHRGKSITFTGGPHWKLGKNGFLHMHFEGLLSRDIFQHNQFLQQLMYLRSWHQRWEQNEQVRRLKLNAEGRINWSDKSNLTFHLRVVNEGLNLKKTDTISGNKWLPATTTEYLWNTGIHGDFHTDWIYKRKEDKVWRLKTWTHWMKMEDQYHWLVDNETVFHTQYVEQSNSFSRIQGQWIKRGIQLEIGAHFQENYFDAFKSVEQRGLQEIKITSQLFWIGGKKEIAVKSHLFTISGSIGPGFFDVVRPNHVFQNIGMRLDVQCRYKKTISKKWTFESTLQSSPVLPDASQLFKGEVRTGIFQRESGMDDLIIPQSTRFKNNIRFSDPKKLWESQLSMVLNYKSPFLGNRIFSGNTSDWFIEKYAFDFSKGFIFQWNIDKYFIQQSASTGLQLYASKQYFQYGLDQYIGENRFFHFNGKWDARYSVGKMNLGLAAGIHFRQRSTAQGALSILTQTVTSGNLQYKIFKKSYLKIELEYLSRNVTGNKGWLWAKIEAKSIINDRFHVFIEIKNAFNNRMLILGDLSADSQLIREFQINPCMVIFKIYKNF